VRILGIDPGYAILGWAVIEKNLQIIDFGVIETSASLNMGQRLLYIYDSLISIIDEFKPETAGIEKLFFQNNSKTAIDVAKTIGIICLALEKKQISSSEYTPLQVKKALTGFGKASKVQMQTMIKTLFKLKEIPKPDDAADALAIATCHSMSNPILTLNHRK